MAGNCRKLSAPKCISFTPVELSALTTIYPSATDIFVIGRGPSGGIISRSTDFCMLMPLRGIKRLQTTGIRWLLLRRSMVRTAGLEPAWAYAREILSLLCIPIPPRPQIRFRPDQPFSSKTGLPPNSKAAWKISSQISASRSSSVVRTTRLVPARPCV